MLELSQLIKESYAFFSQFNVAGLIAIALIFTFTIFFATREAFSWFLKISDLKSDVRELTRNIQALEREIATFKNELSNRISTTQPSIESKGNKNSQEIKPAPTFPIHH